MSLLFASSVSRYATADALQEWTAFQAGCSIVAAAGRTGSAVRSNNIGNAAQFSRGVIASGATSIAMFAWKPSALSVWPATSGLCQIMRSGVAMVSIAPNSAGGLIIRRGPANSGTVLFTSAGGYLADTVYAQLQLKVVIGDGTAGSVEIRLNGNPTPIASVTGVDTNNAGDGGWDEVRWCIGTGGNTAQNNDFCDFVILDGVNAAAVQGAAFNDFLGDCSVRPHFSNAPGASAAWTRVGTDSGANWSQVDEATANSDTDGVSTLTAGTRDTYGMEDLKATGQTIVAVVPVAQVKKLDAGAASVGPAFRHGGVNYDPAAGVVPSTAYTFAQMLNGLWVGQHPSGALWTETNFNATEAGPFKVV